MKSRSKLKRRLTWLLTAVMLVQSVPLTVLADEVVPVEEVIEEDVEGAVISLASGQCGEHITYTLYSDGLLELSGMGDMIDGEVLPEDLKLFAAHLKIDERITRIGNYAFYGCANLIGDLELPAGVTNIGELAFYECSGFSGSLTIPESVTDIGYRAFRYCSGITEIIFRGTTPPTLGNILTFGDMLSLTSICVPAESYDAYVTALTGVLDTSLIVKSEPEELSLFTYTVNEDDETITVTGYMEETNGVLTIPDEIDSYAVTAIGEKAFENGGFTGVTIPDTVTSIGYAAFSGCTSLEKITFCGQFPVIGNEIDGTDIFTDVTAEALYPSNHTGWSSDILLDYGGTITWTPYTMTYEIADADDLYRFAELVNSGSYNLNGILTADITVNENVLNDDGTLSENTDEFREWIPIGPGTGTTDRYTGQFDGNNHTISGLYCVNAPAECGLFGQTCRLTYDYSVQNVIVKDSYFSDTSGNSAGAIVGLSQGNIFNCISYATVKGSRVGGICGYMMDGLSGSYSVCTENCINYGSVSGSSKTGGIVGNISDGDLHCSVNYCTNYGSVTGTGSGHTGGIVGYSIGRIGINYCANLGHVSGTGTIAGIAAHLTYSDVNNCSSTGTGVILMVASNNNGSVSGYYLSDEENDSFSGTTAKTLKEYRSGEVAYLLRSGMGQTIGTDDFLTPGDDKVYQTSEDSPCTGYTNNENGIKEHDLDENGVCIWCMNSLNGLIGDVSGDAQVDTDDLEILKLYFTGRYKEQINTDTADINRDGVFTRADVMFLARYLAGWDGYTLP